MTEDEPVRYSMTGIPIGPEKPKMRTFSKVIIGINLLMLVWIIAGLASTSHNDCVTSTYQDACQTGSDIGRAAGVGMILMIAAIVNVTLGVLWLITKDAATVNATTAAPTGSLRACPFCAEKIQPAAVVCRFCGRDVPKVAAPPPGVKEYGSAADWKPGI